MRVKVELAVAKTGEKGLERNEVEKGVRNVKGGEDEQSEGRDEFVMLPNEQRGKTFGEPGSDASRRDKTSGRPDPAGGVDENDGSPSPDETKRLGNGEGKRGVKRVSTGGMYEV